MKKSRPEKKIRDAGLCIYGKFVCLIMPDMNVDLMNVVESSHDVTKARFDEGLTAVQHVTDIVDALSADGFTGGHPLAGSTDLGPLLHTVYSHVTDIVDALSADGITGGHPPTGSRVGLIEFSHPDLTGIRFNLSTFTSAGEVNNAISSETFDDGSKTATANALWLAAIQYARYHWNPSNERLVWITYGGKSSAVGNPKRPAKWLKDSGVHICTMGIGPNADTDEVEDIASDNWKHCHCKFDSYAMYNKAMAFAAKKVQRLLKKGPKARKKAGMIAMH